MKIAGGLLILCSTTMISFLITRYKAKQIKSIGEIIKLLSGVESALKKSRETRDIIAEINLNYADYFDIESCEIYSLSQDENREIGNVIEILGKTDAETQISAVTSAREYYSSLKDTYESYFQSHKKLYVSFGILTGVFICVLIM